MRDHFRPHEARRDAGTKRFPIGRQFAVVVTFALLALAGLVGYHEAGHARLTRALDADVGTLRRMRWERPVLRGSGTEGNAAAEAYAALADLPPLAPPLREAVAQSIYYGKALTPEAAAELAARQAPLERLRAATSRTWSRTELVVELGEHMRVPDYPRVIDAALLLLAKARSAAPDECLRTATDLVRLGQDLVPGGPLEALSIATRVTSLALPVFSHCATRADLSQLRRAAHELRILATLPPPSGVTIELTDIVTAMKLRSLAALSNKNGPAEILNALVERPKLLAARALYDDPTRFRKLTPASYPDAIDEWKREQRVRSASPFPLVAKDAAFVLDFLYDDMRGQALVRALSVGFATLVERAVRGTLPAVPVGLHEPELRDPFRGKALEFRVATDGRELVLWSVGEDLKDTLGTEDWSSAAPRDVTVRFPLPRPDENRLRLEHAQR